MSARSRDPLPKLWKKLGVNSATVLHRGDASVLYRARSDAGGRPVVVKVLDHRVPRGEPDEAELWRMLAAHKGIQPLLQFGVTGSGHSYVVMEYCADGSYDQVSRNHGPLGVDEVVAVGERIARGLEVVHAHGLLHHAPTPDNILRARFGATLIDFGAAHPLDRAFPSAPDTWHALEHAPPEEVRGDHPSPASDVYRLSSALWTLLAGHAPFSGARGALVTPEEYRARLLSDPAPPVPRDDVPEWLRAVLARGLAKPPDQRFTSAEQLRQALDQRVAPAPAAPPAPTAHVTRADAPAPGANAEHAPAPGASPGGGQAEWTAVPHEPWAPGEPHASLGPPDDGFGVPPAVDMPGNATPSPRRRTPRARPLVLAAAVLVVLAAGVGAVRVASDALRTSDEDQSDRSGTGTQQEGEPDERVSGEDVADAAAGEDGQSDDEAQTPDIAPTGVEVRAGAISATISWSDASGGNASHYVVGAPDGAEGTTLANVGPGTSEVEVTGLNPDVEYCFTVVAVLSTDELAPSEAYCTAEENDDNE